MTQQFFCFSVNLKAGLLKIDALKAWKHGHEGSHFDQNRDVMNKSGMRSRSVHYVTSLVS